MPFFNFRRGGSSSAPHVGSNAQPESVEVIRKRAKHRLIGAAVLVLAAIVGFPLLFDTQPRPIAVDIPIEIPARNALKPLVTPPKTTSAVPAPVVAVAPTLAPPPALASAATVSDKIAAASSLTSTEEIVEKKAVAPVPPAPLAIKNEAKPVLKAESKPEAKPDAKPAVKSEEKPAVTAAVPADDGARAKALLNGQTASPIAENPAQTATETRMVVQVGAFADVIKAREARLKLEKAGLKTYTQVAETSGGKRIRVRVGPFASKAEAEKAASKIKSLDLPATILTL